MSVYFISHAPDQRILANAIENIVRRGFGCSSILYEWDFQHKRDFVEEISCAIVDADVVICLVSKNYVNSLWCVKEFIVACESKRLIAILTDDCDRTKLPFVDTWIDLSGKGQKTQSFVFECKLKSLINQLNPKALDYGEVFEFIERIPITIGMFEGMDEIFQSDLKELIEATLAEHNLEVKLVPEYITSEEEAQIVLNGSLTDIVLYGSSVREGVVQIGAVATRGWKFGSDDIADGTRIIEIDRHHRGFWDLYSLLKAGFGNLERARRHKAFAASCMMEYTCHFHPEKGTQQLVAFYADRAKHLLKGSKWLAAIAMYTEILHLNPSAAFARVYRGYAYSCLDQSDCAIEDYLEAIRLDPSLAQGLQKPQCCI